MAYSDYSSHFSYKMLATYQDQNQHGANAEYFKSGNAVPTGAWTFTPGSAIIPLSIDQDYNERGISIDCESASYAGIDIFAKFGAYIEQDVSSGYGMIVKRQIAEASTYPLVEIGEYSSSATLEPLRVRNDGSGGGILIDQNSIGTGIQINHDYNNASTFFAITITAANAGAGNAGGLDVSSLGATEPAFKVVGWASAIPTSTTDSTGRITIDVGGVARYIPYY